MSILILLFKIDVDMKISKNSEVSHIDRVTPELVKPGMLGTRSVGSDSYACLVVAKPTPKSILVITLYDFEQMKAAHPENFITNEDGIEILNDVAYIKENQSRGTIYSWRDKRKAYYEKGDSSHYTGGLRIGRAVSYLDPSF